MKLQDITAKLSTREARRWIFGVLVVGAVIFSAAWNPPVGKVHKFTEASDYNPKRESGCVNSGEGCHGTETEYVDFNEYHPNAKCTTCHDYQGVGCIPCHSPNSNHECATCHDGSMQGAADRVKITDPYPRGHYRETTHTATGTDMKRPMLAAEGGTAKALCKDCHARDLRNSHKNVPVVAGSEYGDDVGCGECHNDVRAFGLAEVLDDWKKHDCESCHKVGSSSPMHSAEVAEKVESGGRLGCGESGPGCHEGNDLHNLHPNKPATCAGSAETGEPICHDLELQSQVPTATTCGADAECHVVYTDTTGHDNLELHAPETQGPASDSSYYGTACGECHFMDADGRSLITEHDRATSEQTQDSGDSCRNCHNHPASLAAVNENWPERDTAASCDACHGVEDLPATHDADLADTHDVDGSDGCASSGPGCHPTSDLSQVGAPTTTANLHTSCLRCHDKTPGGGNLGYDPELKTCGSGRDCHTKSYDPTTGVHAGTGGTANGTDVAHHAPGAAQTGAVLKDASGVLVACSNCHDFVLGTEHSRPSVSISGGAGTLCTRCHNASVGTAQVVKAGWPARGSQEACAQCHDGTAAPATHSDISKAHKGAELDPAGNADPGACATVGCHTSGDLRVVHKALGCNITGCHRSSGAALESYKIGCGGLDADTSCHVGYSATNHFVSHAADLSGAVDGVEYSLGENVGCFACHVTDLQAEHGNTLAAGRVDGGGSSSCDLCHDGLATAGEFASAPAVKHAIATHDKRCVACHRAGAQDNADGVASPHSRISTEETLPPGAVWADPLDSWRAALTAPVGGGHNSRTAEKLTGLAGRAFPAWRYESGVATYTWTLLPNTGATAWLGASQYPATSVDTTAEITAMTVECGDCHALPEGMNGPHGAAMRVYIDPAYSQTNYANPPLMASQFKATGTERVVCMKCHPMQASSTQTPGGHYVHANHVAHTSRYESTDPTYYGEKCIDCHVRIPHAWKRPRLLVRTAETTGGVEPDVFPYVAKEHDGLVGIELRSYDSTSSLRAASCATGGCNDSHNSLWHPNVADTPGREYWP